jgi:hypothetical protein
VDDTEVRLGRKILRGAEKRAEITSVASLWFGWDVDLW